ncbi:MAG: hypothetical protein R3Y47_12020 [Lachnospiraceae bacterium]
MTTFPKIKIADDTVLRKELDSLFEKATQKQIASWAIELATHILQDYAPQYLNNEIICSGFQIHRLAKACDDKLLQLALRVTGHAVATGHMKEHGIVASDYAIKLININSNFEEYSVINERIWQINKLKEICSL